MAYTICPARLDNVGRFPNGCLHGERPVIGQEYWNKSNNP